MCSYLRSVAALRKTGNVPPPQEGKPLTDKPKPLRRAAKGSEPRPNIKSQKGVARPDVTRRSVTLLEELVHHGLGHLKSEIERD